MPTAPGLHGLNSLHATPDTMQPGETAIVDGVLYTRVGEADPVPVGGSGGGGGSDIFATSTRYGLIYACILDWTGDDINDVRSEIGPLVDMPGQTPWEAEGPGLIQCSVPASVAHLSITSNGSPVSAYLQGDYIHVHPPDPEEGGASIHVMIWGVLSA